MVPSIDDPIIDLNKRKVDPLITKPFDFLKHINKTILFSVYTSHSSVIEGHIDRVSPNNKCVLINNIWHNINNIIVHDTLD